LVFKVTVDVDAEEGLSEAIETAHAEIHDALDGWADIKVVDIDYDGEVAPRSRS
jgi:hypothetical protein